MARLLLVLALMILAIPAAALDDALSNQAPPKPVSVVIPPPADPEVIRQGGDTMADAIFVPSFPFDAYGTTDGYTHDYDEECPYSGSTSPDVVYRLAPQSEIVVDIDMFGSTYDTKIYVYREDLTLVACNDDFYPDYVSKIEAVTLYGDVKYFLVIDGYGGNHGDYVLNIYEYWPPPPCIIECPPYGVAENEPPLTYNYTDSWNGGCNSPEFGNPFQHISSWGDFCGVSGFYITDAGNSRDTDWFTITMSSSGVLGITGDAEVETYMFELGPQDCGSVGVVQNVIIGPCDWDFMTIVGAPGSTVWFWVGPTEFYAPDGSDLFEYDYVLWLTGWYGYIATEKHTWTRVKSLFR